MKSKLIKQNGIGIQTLDGVDYYLILDGKIYHTNPLTSDLSGGGKLSKQNCDEIFGVTDVEKLAEDFAKNNSIYPTAQDDTEYGFKHGFNKAMELNKDKVFTLEDMRNAMDWIMTQYFEFYEQPTTARREQYLESLQQPTEIEVEIEMEKVVDETKMVGAVKGVKGSGDKITTYKTVPKLDSNGCLILKQQKQ
jgi:hypothetical protein